MPAESEQSDGGFMQRMLAHMKPAIHTAKSPAGADDSVFTFDNMLEPTIMSLMFAGAYTCLHVLVELLIVRRGLIVSRDRLGRLSRKDRIYLAEKFPSAINGLVFGLCSSWLMLVRPRFEGTFGIFHLYPRASHYMYSSYVGYSLYDCVAMIAAGDFDFAMWSHHVLGACGAFLMMLYRTASYFPTAFAMTELTVVPTNWVWILRVMGVDKSSRLYSSMHSLRTLSFLLFRTFLAPLTVYHSVHQMDASDTAGKLAEWWREYKELPLIVSVATVVNVCFLGGLNMWWSLMVGRGILLKYLRSQKAVDKGRRSE